MLSTRLLHLGPLEIKIHPVAIVFVLLSMAGLARLGIWQLDRVAEKNTGRDETLSLQAQTPKPIEGLFDGSINIQENDLDSVNLSLTGNFINDKSVWLANQMYQANIGYEVLTPFRLQSNQKLILVSRGWVNARAYDHPESYVKSIEGAVNLTGLLQTKPFTHEQKNKLTDDQWPKRIVHVNMQDVSSLLEETVFPYVVRLNEGSPGLLIKHWKNVTVNVDKNYSYALQWFAMAIALAIVALYLSSNIGKLFRGRTEECSNIATTDDGDKRE